MLARNSSPVPKAVWAALRSLEKPIICMYVIFFPSLTGCFTNGPTSFVASGYVPLSLPLSLDLTNSLRGLHASEGLVEISSVFEANDSSWIRAQKGTYVNPSPRRESWSSEATDPRRWASACMCGILDRETSLSLQMKEGGCPLRLHRMATRT